MSEIQRPEQPAEYLLIRQFHKRTTGIWDVVRQRMPINVVEIDQKDSDGLRRLMDGLRAGHHYKRVIFDCNLRNIGRHWRCLLGVERLVIFDNDLYHHYNRRSAYFGRFVSIFKMLAPHQIIATGLYTVNRFREEGLNVSYLPKSYNPATVSFLGLERDIEVAFVGRTNNRVYADRRVFLEGMRDSVGMHIIRTADGAEYNNTLNRIFYFISADHGLNEFMAKNFEALAAGCVLCTVPTEQDELSYLGFVDMQNVVFYQTKEELTAKLVSLRADPQRAKAIAEAGRKLAEERHCDTHRAAEIIDLIAEPVMAAPRLTWRDKVILSRLSFYHWFSGR